MKPTKLFLALTVAMLLGRVLKRQGRYIAALRVQCPTLPIR